MYLHITVGGLFAAAILAFLYGNPDTRIPDPAPLGWFGTIVVLVVGTGFSVMLGVLASLVR